jgi:uncharacterized protein (DUF1697 family)
MRYVAFLRAINVGGSHVVKMDHLRQLFESLGFSSVETFIASGNVVFEASAKNAKTLQKKIETKLREALGYEVVTFLRTEAELAEMASYQPFQQSDLEAAVALNVVFLGDELDQTSRQKLMALKTDLDDFNVNGREIYWLIRTRQSDSPISNAVLTKALGMPSTIRGVNTIKRMAAKYSGSKK